MSPLLPHVLLADALASILPRVARAARRAVPARAATRSPRPVRARVRTARTAASFVPTLRDYPARR
jgi:hypothetical protein